MGTVKIKNMSGSYNEFERGLRALLDSGCFARDGDIEFVASKPSFAVADGKYIQKSRTEYMPKKNPYMGVTTVDQFCAMCPADRTQFLNSGKAGVAHKETISTSPATDDCSGAFMDGVNLGVDLGAALATPVKETPCDQDTLVVKKADVLVQNSIIFRSQSIPFLKNNGVDITEDDGKYYVLDLKTNEAIEVTPEYVKEKAEKDLVDGNDSAWVRLVKEFDLINELKMTKKVDEGS